MSLLMPCLHTFPSYVPDRRNAESPLKIFSQSRNPMAIIPAKAGMMAMGLRLPSLTGSG
jgi:hypothetical protein